DLRGNSSITSTGTGSTAATIFIRGTAGAGAAGDSVGVTLSQATVTSVDGSIQIIGDGSGPGNEGEGIHITQSTIDATGTGDVTVDGAATPFSGTGIGVLISTSSIVGQHGSGDVDV